jgi:hypothetical protein
MTMLSLMKLKEVFARCRDIPLTRVTNSVTQDQVPSWHCPATAKLVPEIEEVFGVPLRP